MTQSLLLAIPLLLAMEGVDAGVRGDAQNHRLLPKQSTDIPYPDLDGADAGQYSQDSRLGVDSYYYSGNPNCESFGYDFGIKIDSGCPYNYDSATSFADNGLELTNQVTDHCSPTPLDLGSFQAVCTGDNKVTLTLPAQDHTVIMKGSNKGVIYNNLDGTITLDVGEYTKNNGGKWIPAISHIEFCFNVRAFDGTLSRLGDVSLVIDLSPPTASLRTTFTLLCSRLFFDSVVIRLLRKLLHHPHQPTLIHPQLLRIPPVPLTPMLVLPMTWACSP